MNFFDFANMRPDMIQALMPLFKGNGQMQQNPMGMASGPMPQATPSIQDLLPSIMQQGTAAQTPMLPSSMPQRMAPPPQPMPMTPVNIPQPAAVGQGLLSTANPLSSVLGNMGGPTNPPDSMDLQKLFQNLGDSGKSAPMSDMSKGGGFEAFGKNLPGILMALRAMGLA